MIVEICGKRKISIHTRLRARFLGVHVKRILRHARFGVGKSDGTGLINSLVIRTRHSRRGLRRRVWRTEYVTVPDGTFHSNRYSGMSEGYTVSIRPQTGMEIARRFAENRQIPGGFPAKSGTKYDRNLNYSHDRRLPSPLSNTAPLCRREEGLVGWKREEGENTWKSSTNSCSVAHA